MAMCTREEEEEGVPHPSPFRNAGASMKAPGLYRVGAAGGRMTVASVVV
jgi:hypothetical protein